MLTGSGLYTARVRNESFFGGKIETVELEIDIYKRASGFCEIGYSCQSFGWEGGFSH